MDRFDAENNIATAGKIELKEFSLELPNEAHGAAYQAVDPNAYVQAINALSINPKDYIFLDLGCGKGRALVLAAHRGFRFVIGVEFVPALAQAARENLAKLGIPHSAICEADAADFVFPSGKLVLFLYCPFYAPVMERVVRNLRESNCEEVIVVYVRPVCGDLFDQSGFLSRFVDSNLAVDIGIWRGSPRDRDMHQSLLSLDAPILSASTGLTLWPAAKGVDVFGNEFLDLRIFGLARSSGNLYLQDLFQMMDAAHQDEFEIELCIGLIGGAPTSFRAGLYFYNSNRDYLSNSGGGQTETSYIPQLVSEVPIILQVQRWSTKASEPDIASVRFQLWLDNLVPGRTYDMVIRVARPLVRRKCVLRP